MRNLVLVALLGWSSCFAAVAQGESGTPVPSLKLQGGVAPHAGIDAIYARFTAGYLALDAAAVGGLYTENAAYLVPNQDIRIGREPIEASFARFFGRMKQRGEKAAISFEIVQRQVRDTLVCDVGIYTLTITTADGVSRQDRGKFVTVALPAGDGSWRFQVDGYSGLGQ